MSQFLIDTLAVVVIGGMIALIYIVVLDSMRWRVK
jgi:hypothetical protein